MSHTPWVEKYRPTEMKDVILDEYNNNIFTNIIKYGVFPNILLFGLPGTGKTTMIINITNMYLKNIGANTKDSVIHLNASDERGVDVIRNQINQFVSSNCITKTTLKFVILDEVDYMTIQAQQNLKIIINEYSSKVRFCLMCNYISKIEPALRNMFVIIQSNNQPNISKKELLTHICKKENIPYDEHYIENIIYHFKSDIRSMINYIQTYQNIHKTTLLNDEKLKNMINTMKTKTCDEFMELCISYVYETETSLKIIFETLCKFILDDIFSRNDPDDSLYHLIHSIKQLIHDYKESHIELKCKLLYYKTRSSLFSP